MAWAPQTRRQAERGKHVKQWSGDKTRHGEWYDWNWQRLRDDVFAKHPCCIDCERHGRTSPTEECHHVVPIAVDPSKRLERSNVAPLCKLCHLRWEESGPPVWWGKWVKEKS